MASRKREILMTLMIDGKPAERSFGQTVNKMETELEGFQRRVRARNNTLSGFTPADLKMIQASAKAMSGAFGTSFTKIDADAVNLSKNINTSLTSQLNNVGKSATDNGRKIDKALINPQAERGIQRLGERLRDSRGRFLAAGQGASDFTHKLKDVDAQAARTGSTLGSLGSKASGALSGVGGMLSGALAVAGGGFITSILGGVKDKITGAVQTGFDFNKVKEKSLLGFEIKLGGRKEAEDFFNEINKFAERAPQELDQVLDSTNRLMVAFKGKEVLYALDAITDAVAGQGKVGGEATETINGVGLQLQQMLLKGKVSAEETTSLAERGIKAYKYLGDEIAKTDASFAALTDEQRTARVQEMGQKGLISARTAVAVILQGMKAEYHGAAERIAKETLEGIESNTADRLSRLAGQSTQNVFERYKVLRQKFLDSLNSSAGDSMARGINATAGGLIGAMDAAVAAVGSGNLKQLGFDAVSSAAEGVKGAAKSLYDAGKGVFSDLENGWRDAADQHSPSQVLLTLGFDAGASLVTGFQKGAQRTFTQFKPEIEKLIEENARRTGLDADLIRAMIKQESGGQTRVTSPAGARGIAQFMPGTARAYGLRVDRDVDERTDPAKAIRAMADHVRDLIAANGSIAKSLAAYNAGQGAVNKYRGIPPYRETQNYVKSIMSDYERRQMRSGASGGAWRGGTATREIVDQVNSHTDDLYARRAASEGELLRRLTAERDTQKAAINALMQEKQESLRWAESLPQGTQGQREVRERMMYGATETIATIQRDLDNFLNGINEQIRQGQDRLRDAVLKIGTDAPEGMTWQEQAKAEGWIAADRISVNGGRGRYGGYDTPAYGSNGQLVQPMLDLSVARSSSGVASVFGASGAAARSATDLNWQLEQTPKALEKINTSAADVFGNLPPIINTAAAEAKEQAKQFEDIADRIGGVVSGSLARLYRLDIKGFFTNTLRGFADLAQDIIGELVKSKVKDFILSHLNPSSSANGSTGGGGILGTIKNLFGGGNSSGNTLGGGGGGIGGAIKNLLGFGSNGGAGAAMAGNASAASPTALSPIFSAGAGAAGLFGGATAATAAPLSLAVAPGAGMASVFGAAGTLAGGGAGIGAATTGGVTTGATTGGLSMASMGAFMTNPYTLAAAAAITAGVLIWRHFRQGTEKALKKEIAREYGVDVKDMKMLSQIKQLGEGTFGKGNVKKHLLETIRLEPSKELIGNYAEATGQQARGLTLNKQYADPEFKENQFVRRIAGGVIPGHTRGFDHVPVLADAGEYMLRSSVTSREGIGALDDLNEGRARVTPTNLWRRMREEIEKREREKAQARAQAQSQSSTPAASPSSGQAQQQGGVPPALVAALVGALQGNAEALQQFVETYKPTSRGQMLEAMARDNPEAIGRANVEALRRGSIRQETQEQLGMRN